MRQRCVAGTLSLALGLIAAFGSFTSQAHAQTQVKPWFLIVFDTSGSMDEAAAPNSCGYPATKMGAARCAILNIIDSAGDAEFGLIQFAQDHDASPSCNGTSCVQNQDAAWLRVAIADGNTATLRALVDGTGT